MIKMTYCVRKIPDMSEEDFHRYWLEKHGPLVRERAEAMRVKKYIQSHTIADTDEIPLNKALQESRGTADHFDGTAELWWDSIEDLAAGANSPEGAKAAQDLLEDEKNFIDFKNSCIFFSEEHVIVDG